MIDKCRDASRPSKCLLIGYLKINNASAEKEITLKHHQPETVQHMSETMMINIKRRVAMRWFAVRPLIYLIGVGPTLSPGYLKILMNRKWCYNPKSLAKPWINDMNVHAGAGEVKSIVHTHSKKIPIKTFSSTQEFSLSHRCPSIALGILEVTSDTRCQLWSNIHEMRTLGDRQ